MNTIKKFNKIILTIIFTILIFCSKSFAEPKFITSTELRESRHATGITFNPDGTKMYILSAQAKNNGINDDTQDKLVVYSLSSPFSLVNAQSSSNATEKDIRGLCGTVSSMMNPQDIHWNNDGTMVFITERTNNNQPNVCQFDVASPYDIQTLTERDDAGFNMDAGGETDVSDNITEAAGMDFSNDGLKLFVIGRLDEKKIYEFSLKTKFNLTGASYTGNSFDISNVVTDPAAMRFSKNGKQLFINDATEDKIVQFSLSSSFDISSSVSFRGSFSIRADYQNVASNTKTEILEGLEFNNDGSKFFITAGQRNNDANSHFALEYELGCPYGIVACDSTEDKALVGIVEAQIELSKNVIKKSSNSSLRRIEWVRRNKNNKNLLSSQNIRLNFSNEMFSSLAKLISTNSNLKNSNNKKTNDWYFWSEGDISFTKNGEGLLSFGKKIKTEGLTIGVDKIRENKLIGLAFRVGDDHADVASKSYLDQNSYALMLYNSIENKENSYFDSTIGISHLNIDQKRFFNGWKSGNRNGKQFFGTIKFSEFSDTIQFYEKFGKFTFGKTFLSEFSETGSNSLIRFKDHNINHMIASSGLKLKKLKKFNRSQVNILGSGEYIIDFSSASRAQISHQKNNVQQNIIVKPSSEQSIKGGLGAELITESNLNVIFNYEREQYLDSGHSDIFHFLIGFIPNRETDYSLGINASDNSNAELSMIKNIKGFDLKLNLNKSFDKFNNEYIEISLNNQF